MAPSVQRRKVWLTPNTAVPCNNAVKTRNPLKGVPQTPEPIFAASGPKFTILWGYVKKLLHCCLTFFPIVDTRLSCEDTARRSCAMVRRLRIFASCIFSEPPADLHSKFALRPHHVWKYGRHWRLCLVLSTNLALHVYKFFICICIQSPTAEIRRGKNKKEEESRNVGQCPT